MEATTIEVEAEQADQRLDRMLADRAGVSRARIRHLLEVGRIRLAGRTLSIGDKSHRVAPGERFEIEGALEAEDERPTPRPDLELEIAARGRGWLVVNKPAGRGVHPLRPDQEDTVLNAVVAAHPEILGVGEGGLRSGVVHRLDVDTSGALAFALDEETWKRLRGAFADHRVDKRYEALVAGRFESERRVDLDLEITRHQPAHVAVRSTGRRCRQTVRPLRVFSEATHIEVRLETGFLHQIRASMAHLGHPLLGDREYEGPDRLGDLAIDRQMLHSTLLSVAPVHAEAALPADFEAVLEHLAA